MNMTKSLGLTVEEAKSRLSSSGPNHLFTHTPVSLWAIAFKELKGPKARMRRSGEVVLVDAETVVTGNILILSPGIRLAADAKLTVVVNLTIDESTLPGEFLPAEKSIGNDVLAGTVIVGGEGETEIDAIGMSTRLGKLASQLATVEPLTADCLIV
jgi:P-type Ca2+ transporter type 2C